MSDDATEQVTLDELLDLAFAAKVAEVHTSLPAKVEAYNRTAGTVKVSFPIQRMIPDGAGNYVAEGYPTLDDVPIEWPRCGKFSVTFPLEAGDTGRVSFCMLNLGPWRTTGAVGQVGDVGMHTMDGAVFKPGLSPDSNPPSTASATDMVLGSTTDAKGRLVCKPAALELGQGATKGVILANDKTTADTTMAAFITATIAAFTVIQGTIGAVVVPTAPTDFGKNGSGSASTKAL